MKKFLTVIVFILTLGVIFSAPFLTRKSGEKSGDSTVILTLWHADSFEGGTGSRYTFLRKIAESFSKRYNGVYILVSNYSAEGLKIALQGDNPPDLVSFGGCDLGVENFAKEIDFSVLDGGTVGKKRYAVSYLKGSYFQISKGSGDSEIILSKGEYTSPQTACLFSSAKSNKYVLLSPSDAFNRFLIKENATLIGTQRDIVRLRNNGVDFTATPIARYNDLFQYVSLTSNDSKNFYYANEFIKHLLSFAVQDKISSLQMFSSTGRVLYSEDQEFSLAEKVKNEYTFIPFSTKDNYNLLSNTVFSALCGGENYDIIVNSCKNLINVVK